MTMLEVIEIPSVPRHGPYSQAVRLCEVLYVAGQSGMNPQTGQVAGATFEAQARQAFANLALVLEGAGSRLGLVAKVTCYLTDADDFPLLNVIFAEFFPSAPPVRTVPVVKLPKGLLFSIDAIAAL